MKIYEFIKGFLRKCRINLIGILININNVKNKPGKRGSIAYIWTLGLYGASGETVPRPLFRFRVFLIILDEVSE